MTARKGGNKQESETTQKSIGLVSRTEIGRKAMIEATENDLVLFVFL